MRQLILASLLLLPVAAMADDAPCKFSAARNLDLDLSGIKAVRFENNAYDIKVEGGAAAGKGTVRGKACASEQDAADNLIVTQEKQGDTLVVTLTEKRKSDWSGFGSHYSYLKVAASIPASLPVTVKVGSGDAEVRNVATLDSTVGSGDLDVYDVKGSFRTTLGSGDVKAERTGPIEVGTVGSGDFTAKTVNGGVRIGAVGSGDAKLRDVKGSVDVGTAGSGDVDVDGVSGDFTVRSQGSGDIEHHGVSGKVNVPDNDR